MAENFAFFAGAYGLSGRVRREAVAWAVGQTGLTGRAESLTGAAFRGVAATPGPGLRHPPSSAAADHTGHCAREGAGNGPADLCLAIDFAEFILGKLIPYGLIAFLQIGLVMSTGYFWFRVPLLRAFL